MSTSKQSELQLVSGAGWMIAMRWSMRLGGFISTLILARLLAPEDFGIIAMAKVAMGLLEALSTTGTQLALIRTPDRSRELYDTAWTINLAQRMVMACALFLVAPLAVEHFNEPRTLAVIQVLAGATLIRGFFNIGTVDFRKDLNFAAEFRFGVIEKSVSITIAITLALLMRNYWALTLAITAEAITTVILSYILHPYRPKISLSRWTELWRFSLWILASRLAFFGNSRLDQLLVGGAFDTASMGYYNFGTELGTLPGDEVAEPLRRSIFPNLSKLGGDRDAFAETTITIFGAAAFFLIPIGFGLAAIAPTFLSVLLGEKWMSAAPILSIAALYGVVSGMTGILELPLLIVGKERLAAIVAWLQVALLLPAISTAIRFNDLSYVAGARALVVLLGFLFIATAVARTLGLTAQHFARVTWRSLLASIIMFTAITQVADAVNWRDTVTLVSSIGFGIVLFPALIFMLWTASGRPEGPESQISQWLAKRFQPDRNAIN